MLPHRGCRLGVNIDHVATDPERPRRRPPDPVRAAEIAAAAGADGITAHLREDRRHIGDEDIERLKARIALPLNLEMAATDGDAGDRACATGRTPPASCRSGARSAPPRAGSMPPAGDNALRPIIVARLARPASACRCSSSPIRVRSTRPRDSARRWSSCTPAPIATRPTGDGTARAESSRGSSTAAALRPELGLEVHAGHGLTFDTVGPVAAHRRDRRAQYRPFPDRRGDLRRPRRGDSRACAR